MSASIVLMLAASDTGATSKHHPVDAATRKAFGHGQGKNRPLVDAANHASAYTFRKPPAAEKEGEGGEFYRIAIPCTPSLSSSDWMLDATEHFPKGAMVGYQNGENEDLTEDDEEARLFQHNFKERNKMNFKDQARCNSTRHVEATWCPYGMAACFHLLVHRITVAEDNGAAVTVSAQHGDLYGTATSSFCGSKGNKKLSCFFDFPNQCQCDWDFCGPHLPPPWSKYERGKVPDQWQQRGSFWWTAHAMHAMWHLSKKMKDLVEQTKQDIGYTHPIVGMHVRHGDSCTARVDCHALKNHMAEAEKLRLKYGISTVFLATDSEKVVEEAKRDYTQFKVVHLMYDRGNISSTTSLDDCHIKGNCDVVEDVRSMVIDLELLADADAFVGAFSSNVGRLAIELSFARKRCYPPFVSLDIPWCHNNGQAMGDEHLNEKNKRWKDTSC